MRKLGTWGTGVLALGLLALPVGVRAQQRDMPGPIDSLQDLQDTGRLLFMLADDNRDGQISQKEAIDAGNQLAGGFFFRADTNGDGVLSQEEARQARDAFLQSRPWLNYVIKTTQATVKRDQSNANTNRQGPFRALSDVLDSNNDKQIQATELRQAVQSAVQGFFAAADTNRDGQMSPTEVNAAVAGVAKSVAQAAFQAADKDNNGSLSKEEWTKALEEPSNVVFNILDGNHDGQLTQQEAQQAQRVIASQIRSIRVPRASSSPTNLLRGQGQPAPVPTFGTPKRPQPAQPTPPAQPQ
jgi:Ca2+-binding EF-hand superfamily protein